MGIFLMPFALLLKFFYDFFQSYGIALILFALIIKLVLFPFSLKGKRSMIQMNLLSGKMQQLQKQYGKDRERYNLEVQKLYEKEKVNPMSGCLWSFIPILFLMVLYGIIREPLTYFMGLTMEQIQLIAQELDWQTVAVSSGWVTPAAMEKLVQQVADGKLTSVFQNGAYNQMYLASMINPDNLAALQALLGDAGSKLFVMDFSFLGINLANIPKWNFWTAGFSWASIGLFLLPLVSVGISLLSMQVSLKTNQMNNQAQDETMAKTNRTMMIMMPLMSLWIGFTVPAGPPPRSGSARRRKRRSAARRRPGWSASAALRRRRRTGARSTSRRTSPLSPASTRMTAASASAPMPGAAPISPSALAASPSTGT